MTPQERLLWSHLKRAQLGYSFRRQEPMGPYVADFVCFEARLVIELDGCQHLNNPKDLVRDAEMARHGFHVLRFWNAEVTGNLSGVLERIAVELALRGRPDTPPPGLPPQGGEEF